MPIFVLAGVMVLSLIIAIASVGGVLSVVLSLMGRTAGAPAAGWEREGTVLAAEPLVGDIAA